MKSKYDVVIIGSGLGGLVSANILARHGYRVCVLEKNKQYGGNLQTFVRDKNIFDTGVHYIGSLGEGENLHQYFSYLGVMKDLKLAKLDNDQFDVITFGDDAQEYTHAQGYDHFSGSLIQQFPEEEKAINEYCKKIQEVCESFPLYNLELSSNGYDISYFNLKFSDYLDTITDNKKLKAVLAGSNFLYAGTKNTPLYVHALSINSYIKSSWRCIDGGSQITRSLIKRIKEFGGEVYNNQEVIGFDFIGNEIDSVITKSGKQIKGDYIISNIEPKLTVKMLAGKGMRKSYVNRINQIKSMISVFSVYIVFKPKTFKYINHNFYHFKSHQDIWDTQNYSESTWPESYMLSMGVRKNQDDWSNNLTAMAYMKFDEVEKWKNSFNTVSEESNRGEQYEKFKKEKIAVFIDEIEKKFPNIRACIQSVHASSPLSYRDYIGSNNGAIYGYEKDAENPMMSFLSPKTKTKKLFFTGQSLNMHGILGVTISGFLTCSHIVGKEKLMQSVKNSLI
jgi:all-trans-retinol 13,14-reductase